MQVNPELMRFILFLGLFSLAVHLPGQAPAEPNVWKTLAKLTYKKEYNELLGFKVDVPVFSEDVRALEGQEVEVRGYIIPVDGYKSQSEFVFSAFPYNMCFFCGGAGPETVMEVVAATPIAYTTEPVTIRGILHLNEEDINRLIYSLEEVVLVQ